MAGFKFRFELSESVLLHGLWWSAHFNSFSVLLCRLPDAFPVLSLLPLWTSGNKDLHAHKQNHVRAESLFGHSAASKKKEMLCIYKKHAWNRVLDSHTYLPSASKHCYALLHAQHLLLLSIRTYPKSASSNRADIATSYSTDIEFLLPVDWSLSSVNTVSLVALLSIICNAFPTKVTCPLSLSSYPSSLFMLHIVPTHHLLCRVM